MSHRTPSRKLVAALAAAGQWTDEDVVLAGTDAHGRALLISRAQALVPASLVRRWLLIKDGAGVPRLVVVREFVSGDGCLFTAKRQPANFETSAAPSSRPAAPAWQADH